MWLHIAVHVENIYFNIDTALYQPVIAKHHIQLNQYTTDTINNYGITLTLKLFTP